MSTTFTQRIASFLHIGKIPGDVRTQLLSEDRMLYVAEGIGETAIFRHFRAPGVYSSHRRITFIGFFALTERRVVISAKFYNSISVDMAFDDPRFRQFEFKATRKYLSLKYDPALQSPKMSGQIEIRLHLPDVAEAAKILQEKGATLTTEDFEL